MPADVPLRDLMEARLAALERRIEDVDDRAREAMKESRVAADAAALRQNEWRATVNDVASGKIDRDTAQAMIDNLTEKLNRLATIVDGIQGRAGGIGSSVALVMSVMAIGSVIVIELLRK